MSDPFPSLEAAIAALRPVYHTIGALQARREELRAVPLAQAFLDDLLASDQMRLDALIEEQAALEKRLHPKPKSTLPPPPRLRPDRDKGVSDPTQSRTMTPPADHRLRRRELKKLLVFGFFAQLDAEVQAEINGIIDDGARPLGAALALLGWDAFEQPVAGEGHDTHLIRLQDWGELLCEYHNTLEREVAADLRQVAGSLALWERWRARETHDGRTAWEAYVERERGRLQQAITNVEANLRLLRCAAAEKAACL
ncbi:hypothetical protein EKD04_022280 [Chloroflexales bacterium ZM16-3]|nr:hypothetical protein [Chloroflexales bacterium ZM16-3]